MYRFSVSSSCTRKLFTTKVQIFFGRHYEYRPWNRARTFLEEERPECSVCTYMRSSHNSCFHELIWVVVSTRLLINSLLGVDCQQFRHADRYRLLTETGVCQCPNRNRWIWNVLKIRNLLAIVWKCAHICLEDLHSAWSASFGMENNSGAQRRLYILRLLSRKTRLTW